MSRGKLKYVFGLNAKLSIFNHPSVASGNVTTIAHSVHRAVNKGRSRKLQKLLTEMYPDLNIPKDILICIKTFERGQYIYPYPQLWFAEQTY